MWKVTNTSTDRTKVHLHRTAPRMVMEPHVNGQRLMMGGTADVTDESYEHNKDYYNGLVEHGIIAMEKYPSDSEVKYPPAAGVMTPKLDAPVSMGNEAAVQKSPTAEELEELEAATAPEPVVPPVEVVKETQPTHAPQQSGQKPFKKRLV